MSLFFFPKIKATFVLSWLVNYFVLSEIKPLSNHVNDEPERYHRKFLKQLYTDNTVASTTSERCPNQNLGRYTRLTSSFKIKQQN